MIREVEDADFLEINQWRRERNATVLPIEFYPRNGLIVPGIAAGFLTVTDSAIAMMENFVSNPKAYKEDREAAIIEIIERLTKKAVELDYKYLWAVTNHPKVEHYISLSGGKPLYVKLFGKELENGGR